MIATERMKILIVDDHPVVVSGCRSLFASDTSVKIDEAADAKSGHRAFVQKRPDVTVIDAIRRFCSSKMRRRLPI